MRWSIEELIEGIKTTSNNDLKWRYRIIYFPFAIWRMIKVFFHWLFKGYCHCTIWALNYYFMETFIERLKMFKKTDRSGYPWELKSDEEWEKIIERLIKGFEVMKSEEYASNYESPKMVFKKETVMGKDVNVVDFERTPKQKEQMLKAIKKQRDYDEETMRLFTKYFRALWY